MSDTELDAIIEDSEQEGLDEAIEDVSDEPEEQAKAKQEDEEDDIESYGRRVQKRINKLHYKHAKAEERWQKENSELRAKLEEIERRQNEQNQERDNLSLEAQRKELLARRKDALEIADYDELNDIDEKLMDIKLQANKPEPPRQQPKAEPQQDIPEYNAAMAAWQDRNQWAFDPNQASRTQKANSLLQKLLDKGYEVDEPETYEQLDKLLKREAPPPVGAPDRGNVTGNEKGFTAEDKRLMREFGLDPDDAKARKLWIKNRG